MRKTKTLRNIFLILSIVSFVLNIIFSSILATTKSIDEYSYFTTQSKENSDCYVKVTKLHSFVEKVSKKQGSGEIVSIRGKYYVFEDENGRNGVLYLGAAHSDEAVKKIENAGKYSTIEPLYVYGTVEELEDEVKNKYLSFNAMEGVDKSFLGDVYLNGQLEPGKESSTPIFALIFLVSSILLIVFSIKYSREKKKLAEESLNQISTTQNTIE